MEFYGTVFGTKPEIMSFGDLPPGEGADLPPIPPDAVMHATLPIGDGMIFASDDPSGTSEAMAGCNPEPAPVLLRPTSHGCIA